MLNSTELPPLFTRFARNRSSRIQPTSTIVLWTTIRKEAVAVLHYLV